MKIDAQYPTLVKVTGTGITVHSKAGDVPAILMTLHLGATGQEEHKTNLILQQDQIHLLLEFLTAQAARLQLMSTPASGVQH
jgi:hypothetical protein